MLFQGGECLVRLVPVDPAHNLEVGEKINGPKTSRHGRLVTRPFSSPTVISHKHCAEEIRTTGDDHECLSLTTMLVRRFPRLTHTSQQRFNVDMLTILRIDDLTTGRTDSQVCAVEPQLVPTPAPLPLDGGTPTTPPLDEGPQMVHIPQQCHVDEDCVVRKEEGTRRHRSNQPVQQLDVELVRANHLVAIVVLFLCRQAKHPRERGLRGISVRDRTTQPCDNPFRKPTTSGVLHTRGHIGRRRNRCGERRSQQCIRRSSQCRARFVAGRHTQVPQSDLQSSGGHSELPAHAGDSHGLRTQPVNGIDTLHRHE